MIFLNPSQAKIKRAKRAFHEGMSNFIYTRLDNLSNPKKKLDFNKAYVLKFIESFLIDQIDEILIASPPELLEIERAILPMYKNSTLLKGIKYVFNYDLFIKKANIRYDAYNLAAELDINTCPYCNRNYTNTVISKKGVKICRPQFDHYFDKDTHSLLAISFYNLVPSCSTCNSSVKGTKKMNLKDFSHPYLDNFIDDFKFTYKFKNDTKTGLKIEIRADVGSKIEKTIKTFAIEEIYNSHCNELRDLIKVRNYFSDNYMQILKNNLLKDVIVSKEELYRIIFGAEIDTENFINRPFSKFKYDFLKELGII